MTRFEIRPTHQPLKLMRVAHSRTRLPRRLGEPGLFYRKFPRVAGRVAARERSENVATAPA